jgi:hypothetical protein
MDLGRADGSAMARKLISYDEWINRTKVFARPRSDQLVAIDRILKDYDKASGHADRVKLRTPSTRRRTRGRRAAATRIVRSST